MTEIDFYCEVAREYEQKVFACMRFSNCGFCKEKCVNRQVFEMAETKKRRAISRENKKAKNLNGKGVKND